jgi:recombination protein RecR
LETLSSLDELTQALRCLPGVGPKAAQRMALHCCSTTATARSASVARLEEERPARSGIASAAATFTETSCAICVAPASVTRRCFALWKRRPTCS